MTFAELQRGVFDDLQYQAQPKPGVQDRVRRYLNEGLERVLRRPRLKQLRLGSMPLRAVPGQGFYGCPMILERIDYVIDMTNGRKLRFRTRDWYRNLDPSLLTSGTPAVWVPEGIVPVRRYPTPDPTQGDLVRMYVHSDHASDVTQTLTMTVSYSEGYEVTMNALLTGMTPSPIGWEQPAPVQVTSMYLNALATGPIYVTDRNNTDRTNPVATIKANTPSSRHIGIRLYPTPSEAIAYEIEGQRVIPTMKYDYDEPPFSADFHEMLQCYARARFYRKDGRLQQSREEMDQFERFALDLTAHVEYPVNYKPVAGKLSAEGARWSDLGPNYPADRLGLISD